MLICALSRVAFYAGPEECFLPSLYTALRKKSYCPHPFSYSGTEMKLFIPSLSTFLQRKKGRMNCLLRVHSSLQAVGRKGNKSITEYVTIYPRDIAKTNHSLHQKSWFYKPLPYISPNLHIMLSDED